MNLFELIAGWIQRREAQCPNCGHLADAHDRTCDMIVYKVVERDGLKRIESKGCPCTLSDYEVWLNVGLIEAPADRPRIVY